MSWKMTCPFLTVSSLAQEVGWAIAMVAGNVIELADLVGYLPCGIIVYFLGTAFTHIAISITVE